MKIKRSTFLLSRNKYLRLIPVFILPLLVSASLIQTFSSEKAYADLVSEWQAGYIISDSKMTDTSTMSVSKIQSFLNGKVTNCDTNGQQRSEFGGPDLNGDGKVQRWEWGKSKYNQTKFPCLKDYTLGGKSAARIIYDKAQKYNINPQVLIVLLQKEQSLVTDTWPLNIQYKTATGYGCPDTAPCDSQYFGLSNQLDWAAKMFRAIMDNAPTWYTPYEVGNNYIQYNPSSSCGGSTVNIQNRATQALYNYTPYQPNKAALNAGWGSASCGAYGNRNFYLYFTNWFGPTRYSIQGSIENYYNANNGSTILGNPVQNAKTDGHGFWWQKFENGFIAGQATTGYFAIKGSIGKYYGNNNGPGTLGKPVGVETRNTDGSWSQQFANGYIVGQASTGYWESSGSIRSYWMTAGSINSRLGLPTGRIINFQTGYYQTYEFGVIAGSTAGGYFAVKGSIGSTYSSNMTKMLSVIGLPVSNEQGQNGIWEQEFEKGYIIGSNGKYYPSYGSIRDRWLQTGGWTGSLGPIIADVTGEEGKTMWQKFKNGYIIKSPNSGVAWESKGSIRSIWASLGYQNGRMGFPTGPQQYSNGIWSQSYDHGTIQTKQGKLHSVTYQ